MLKYVRFAELPVSDQDRAIRFYTQRLGLRVAQDSPYEEGWRWVALEIPGAQTRILLTRRPNEGAWDVPSLVITVEDLPEFCEQLRAQGITFTQEPTKAFWNPDESFALFRDSEGNTVMLGTA